MELLVNNFRLNMYHQSIKSARASQAAATNLATHMMSLSPDEALSVMPWLNGTVTKLYLKTAQSMAQMGAKQLNQWNSAVGNTFSPESDGENIFGYWDRKSRLASFAGIELPKKIKDIRGKYGLQLHDPDAYEHIAQNDFFDLYRTIPTKAGIHKEHNPKSKGFLAVPPTPLGHDVFAFLPREQKSFVHAVANEGIPMYIPVLKHIDHHDAVKTMTVEDYIESIQQFLEVINKLHDGKPTTLMGYCAGGKPVIYGAAAGKFDDLTDGIITGATPMGGDSDLSKMVGEIPEPIRDAAIALRNSGNHKVVDGFILSAFFGSADGFSSPILDFLGDYNRFDGVDKKLELSDTRAAMLHWLRHDRIDLPPKIVDLSFVTYMQPIEDDGTLPFEIFGERPNIKELDKVPYLNCLMEKDTLVPQSNGTQHMKFLKKALFKLYPGGHIALLTDHAIEGSPNFIGRMDEEIPGPIQFHRDLEARL